MPRPFWKGYLKLSLVSCPVAMYPAASASERISFRQINKATGNRLKQQMVDAETGEPVEAEDKGRGYEIAKDTYIAVEDDELKNIAIESTHTIDIETFVPRSEVDERYLDSPYYLVPEGKVGVEAFAVIREAMRRKKMAGLGRVVLHRREHIVLLEPLSKGLLATTLRYAYEVRSEAEPFEDIPDVKVDDEMLELAAHIIDSKKGNFEPAKFEDRYEGALIELLKKKQAGQPIKQIAAAPSPTNVVNLMDALKRSLGAESGQKKPAAPSVRPPSRATKGAKPKRKLKRTG